MEQNGATTESSRGGEGGGETQHSSASTPPLLPPASFSAAAAAPSPAAAAVPSPTPAFHEHKSRERTVTPSPLPADRVIIELSDDDDEDMGVSAAAASAAAASSSAEAAAPAAPATPILTSRSGRRVIQPKESYSPATKVPMQTATKKPTSKNSRSNSSKSQKAKGGKSGGSSRRSSSAAAASATAASSAADYRGEGFTVRDHAWYTYDEVEWASPPIENIDSLYQRISCEEACRQAGIEMVRELRLQLREETVEALRSSISSPTERGEKDKMVLNLCDSGQLRHCHLVQADSDDPDSIKVVATKYIRNRECIGVYMGTLREADSFEEVYGARPEANSSSYEIGPANLPPSYHGAPLILEPLSCANECRFIRDPRWDDLEISANVQCRVVWHHARGLPYLALIALADIEAHAELFVDWGQLAWNAHARGKLHRESKKSWEYHHRIKLLQRLLAERKVAPYAGREVLPISTDIPFEDFHANVTQATKQQAQVTEGKPAASEEKEQKEHIRPSESSSAASSSAAAAAAAASSSSPAPPDLTVELVDDKVVYRDSTGQILPSSSPLVHAFLNRPASSPQLPSRPLPPPMPRDCPPPSKRGHSPTFVLRNTLQVFDNCGVELMEGCDYSAIPEEVKQQIKQVAGRPGILRPSLQAVLETGRCPKAAVYEVVSLRHPARFYTTPDCASYALLARETIAPKEPIGVYVGKVHLADEFHSNCGPEDRIKQVYAYDMSQELFPEGYQGPGLVCESLSRGGNECRFINDTWCRNGGGSAKNAEALLVFDPLHGNMPVMVITAIRQINKGEEIITDYGEVFWAKISTALVTEHITYHHKVLPQIREMEERLRQAMREEAAKEKGVSVEEISPDSLSLPLPPLPDRSTPRWECYRDLFNQHEVIYPHNRPPLRVDPLKHNDTFARDMSVRNAKLAEMAAAKEKEREARAAAKAKAKGQGENIYARPTGNNLRTRGNHPPTSATGQRRSSRIPALAAAAEEAAAAAAPAPSSPSLPAYATHTRHRSSRKKNDEHPLQPADGEQKDAAVPNQLPAGLTSDDDVQLLSSPPLSSKRPPRVSEVQLLSYPRSSEPAPVCDTCGAAAKFREFKERTFRLCRLCFKKKCSQEIEEEKQRRLNKKGERGSAGSTGSVASASPAGGPQRTSSIASSSPPTSPSLSLASSSNPPDLSLRMLAASPSKRQRDADVQSIGEQKDGSSSAAAAAASSTPPRPFSAVALKRSTPLKRAKLSSPFSSHVAAEEDAVMDGLPHEEQSQAAAAGLASRLPSSPLPSTPDATDLPELLPLDDHVDL